MSDPQALVIVELAARLEHAERQFAAARAHWENETQKIALERDRAREDAARRQRALYDVMGQQHVMKYALKFVEDWAEDPHFETAENRKAQLQRVRESISEWHRRLVAGAHE